MAFPRPDARAHARPLYASQQSPVQARLDRNGASMPKLYSAPSAVPELILLRARSI